MDLKERIQELCKQKNASMNKVETDKCYRILRTKRGQNKDIMVEIHPEKDKKGHLLFNTLRTFQHKGKS